MFYGHNKMSLTTTYTYGLLYNLYVANNNNFAPTGWHVPSETEYTILINFLGGNSIAGGKLKETGLIHWESPNTGATNSSGFNAFGAGWRNSDGSFYFIKYYGFYYTNTLGLDNQDSNMYLSVYYDSTVGQMSHYESNKNLGVPIRLVKNDSSNTGSVSDYDGNIYNTVKIGDQVWTMQNWKCTHLSNGTLIPEIIDNYEWRDTTTEALCAYNNDWNNV